MGLLAPELAGMVLTGRSDGLSAFAGTLAIVMPRAQRAKVSVAMVVARANVVHVCRDFGASVPVYVTMHAAMTVTSEDANADRRPVGR